MAKHQCDNSNGYSSPVPVIGLYIAGASLVCLLLMLWDIFFAILRKARYIPCRRFSLNSVTLTLLAVVSKLPVDLTTNMPSARDQLSKLTGTTLTCICIGFMAPSVASNKRSESISNMISLSIFVVTVAVNICIQLGTGVIFSFVVEHIIIMCCMFMLLAILWFNTLALKRAALSKENVDNFLTIPWGEPICLFHRVKRWYISTCFKNPQLLLCTSPLSSAVAPICIICSLVLAQATYRSIVARTLEFCEGLSDYGWSMWIIVITQSITVIIGASIVVYRWLFATFLEWDVKFLSLIENELDDLKLLFCFMKRRSLKRSIMVLSKFIVKSVLSVFLIFIHAPSFVVALIVSWIFMEIGKLLGGCYCCIYMCFVCAWPNYFNRKQRIREEFLFGSLSGLSEKVILICMDNMEKWMNVGRNPPLYHRIVGMLSRHHSAAPRHLNNFVAIGNTEEARSFIKKENTKEARYKVTCFSMVLLVKVVNAIVPPNLAKPVRDTLDEAFEIVYYIDEKINVESIDTRKRQLAKLLWEGGDIIDDSKTVATEQAGLNDTLRLEWFVVNKFMQVYASTEDLRGPVLQQLFSEMLQDFLAQLPVCVFKEVNDNSVEDSEERARFITKLFCRLDSSLEDEVQWNFPDGWLANTTPIFNIDARSQDISTEDEDGGSATTAQNVLTPEIHPADVSNNV